MVDIELGTVSWLVSWAFIGSTLGFFTIRNKPDWTIKERVKEYIKSVGVGVFFAFPVFVVLCEKDIFSVSTSIVLSGSVAFAVTDFIIVLWPRLLDSIGTICNKLIERFVGRY